MSIEQKCYNAIDRLCLKVGAGGAVLAVVLAPAAGALAAIGVTTFAAGASGLKDDVKNMNNS